MKRATGYCPHCSGPMNVKDVGVKVCPMRDSDSDGGYCARKAYPRSPKEAAKLVMPNALTEEQRAACLRWHYVAMCYGYNELAKKAKTLGEKVYCRVARDKAEQDFLDAGGDIGMTRDGTPILTLPDTMPRIEFRESDLELMRAEIARVDALKKKPVGEERPEQLVRIRTPAGHGLCNWPGNDTDPEWWYGKRACTNTATVVIWRNTVAGRMMDHADEYSACAEHESLAAKYAQQTNPGIPIVDK